MEGRTVPVLAGCTASGKSAAAMVLCGMHDLEIVNADSRQIYRGMDIGTAKPDNEDRRLVKHHLLDIVNPDETFSAGMYCRIARDTVTEIFRSGVSPLLVGGSGLYIMAFTGSLDDLPARCDAIRSVLRRLEDGEKGFLHRFLRTLDPSLASKTAPADRVRLVRALEIILQSGLRASSLRRGGSGSDASYRVVTVEIGREELRERISTRTSIMFEHGLVDEVRGLLSRGYGRNSILGNTIGYTEVLDYLDGVTSLDQAKNAVEMNTWRLARRQRNMFRRLEGSIPWDGRDTGQLRDMLFGNSFRQGVD